MRDTLVARCSDDFYPRAAASHTSHVGICAYNSLFMGALVQVAACSQIAIEAACDSRHECSHMCQSVRAVLPVRGLALQTLLDSI